MMHKSISDTKNEFVSLITLRYPTPARYFKMFNTLSKKFRTNLVTGSIFQTQHLRMNVATFLTYANLFCKVIRTTNPIVIDINALSCANVKSMKNVVVDFRTPFPYELKWLGHKCLSSIAKINEKLLTRVSLVIAANELMAKYCIELGSKVVKVVPNYPNKEFQQSIEARNWKIMNGLNDNNRVILFTGGVRLRQIYGLDMLLESWKIVENSNDYCTLAILGDDSIEYVQKKARSLHLKRLFLSGMISSRNIANWINCTEVCLAPRTIGFSDKFYNDKDSTKISEYASFRKPIVATSYAPSDQYLLVKSDPLDFAEGILKGLDGKIRPSTPHYWEESEKLFLDSIEKLWFK